MLPQLQVLEDTAADTPRVGIKRAEPENHGLSPDQQHGRGETIHPDGVTLPARAGSRKDGLTNKETKCQFLCWIVVAPPMSCSARELLLISFVTRLTDRHQDICADQILLLERKMYSPRKSWSRTAPRPDIWSIFTDVQGEFNDKQNNLALLIGLRKSW